MIPVTCKKLSVTKFSDAVKIGLDKKVVQQKIDDGVLSAVANLWLGLKGDLKSHHFLIEKKLTMDVSPIEGRIQGSEWISNEIPLNSLNGKLFITMGRGTRSNYNKGNVVLRGLVNVAAYSVQYPVLSIRLKTLFTRLVLSTLDSNNIPFVVVDNRKYKLASLAGIDEIKLRGKITQNARDVAFANKALFGISVIDGSPAKRNNQSSVNNNSENLLPAKRNNQSSVNNNSANLLPAKRNNQSSGNDSSTDVPPNKRHRFD